MFQTEINHILQGYSTEWLDSFMIGVSWTGGQTFLVGLLCLIALAIDLRRGILLVQIFLITVIATDILKTVFELPRPFFVDSTLMSFGALKEGMVAMSDGAAQTFFSLPSEKSIMVFRTYDWEPGEFGLPSGHVSSAVALWGGLGLVFRKNRFGLFAVIMVALMMVSRLYLAMHFLADVLAGLALATACLVFVSILMNRLNWRRLFLSSTYSVGENRAAWALITVGFLMPTALVFSGEGHIGRMSSLMAVNLALVGLVGMNIPFEVGNVWQRLGRFVIGIGLYVALNEAVKLIPIPTEEIAFQLIKGFVPVFALFFIAPMLISFTMKDRIVNLRTS